MPGETYPVLHDVTRLSPNHNSYIRCDVERQTQPQSCPKPNHNPNVTWFELPSKSDGFVRGSCATFPANFVTIGRVVIA